MGRGISTRDWKAIRRDRQLYDIYLASLRKRNMRESIHREIHGKPKIWVKRDVFGLITNVRYNCEK
jgi:hypothetical protein